MFRPWLIWTRLSVDDLEFGQQRSAVWQQHSVSVLYAREEKPLGFTMFIIEEGHGGNNLKKNTRKISRLFCISG